MRVLVVEDDKKIASFVMNGLRQAGFAVDHAGDGEEGVHLAMHESYDAAVIDIMLPRLDGLSLIDEIRRSGVNTPVLILSARRTVDDRVKGSKPGGRLPDETLRVLRRARTGAHKAFVGTDGGYLPRRRSVDGPLTRRVVRSGVDIELQPKEFSLLEYFMRNEGRVVSKTLIMEHIYDYNFDPQTNVVDVLVCRLRNKLDKDFENKMIQTIRGVGYVLKEP
jgi:DNA-binding response OmpR family regulator